MMINQCNSTMGDIATGLPFVSIETIENNVWEVHHMSFFSYEIRLRCSGRWLPVTLARADCRTGAALEESKTENSGSMKIVVPRRVRAYLDR